MNFKNSISHLIYQYFHSSFSMNSLLSHFQFPVFRVLLMTWLTTVINLSTFVTFFNFNEISFNFWITRADKTSKTNISFFNMNNGTS